MWEINSCISKHKYKSAFKTGYLELRSICLRSLRSWSMTIYRKAMLLYKNISKIEIFLESDKNTNFLR